jgi:uncharacterized protein YcbX
VKVLSAFIYPVKSMRGVAVPSLVLDARGIVGDRRWMVVDAEGRFVSQRTVPALACIQPLLTAEGLRLDDGSQSIDVPQPHLYGRRDQVSVWKHSLGALDGGDEVAAWLSQRLKLACRLVAFADDERRPVNPQYAANAETTFTDGYPMLWVNEASLDALNAKLREPIPMSRFRPNVVVRAEASWVEDQWRLLETDALSFAAVKPCARCVVITVDQLSGEKPQGSAALKTLTKCHSLPDYGPVFGMNVVARGTGELHVGAAIGVKMA